MYRKKTSREKLANSKDFPRVQKITKKQRKIWGTGTIVISAPLEVDEIMKKVPKGKITTINEIRSILAKKHSATIACPITTGIFACIASRAAEEEANAGKKRITPYWRTLKSGGVINEKYPGGIEKQKKKLESEGHAILKKGKKYIVKDFDKVLFRMA